MAKKFDPAHKPKTASNPFEQAMAPQAEWPYPRGYWEEGDPDGEYEGEGEPATPPGVERPVATEVTITVWPRDRAVREWVLKRADGSCECCDEEAPFLDVDGVPFLEVHHMVRLTDGGCDRHTNAVALCPNCHRRLHHGADAEQRRRAIYSKVPELVEPEHEEKTAVLGVDRS